MRKWICVQYKTILRSMSRINRGGECELWRNKVTFQCHSLALLQPEMCVRIRRSLVSFTDADLCFQRLIHLSKLHSHITYILSVWENKTRASYLNSLRIYYIVSFWPLYSNVHNINIFCFLN